MTPLSCSFGDSSSSAHSSARRRKAALASRGYASVCARSSSRSSTLAAAGSMACMVVHLAHWTARPAHNSLRQLPWLQRAAGSLRSTTPPAQLLGDAAAAAAAAVRALDWLFGRAQLREATAGISTQGAAPQLLCETPQSLLRERFCAEETSQDASRARSPSHLLQRPRQSGHAGRPRLSARRRPAWPTIGFMRQQPQRQQAPEPLQAARARTCKHAASAAR